jgi:hypothetical protein
MHNRWLLLKFINNLIHNQFLKKENLPNNYENFNN